MNNPALDQPWSCEVQARGQVIRYRCTGSGRPLLFLHCGSPLEGTYQELLAALERRHRVIVPEPPPADADLTAWLDAFLEGLGGTDVRILAIDRLCLPASELALTGPDDIARLVLIPAVPGREPVLGDTVEAELARARVPFLVAHDGQPTAELVERVTRFLVA
jgi:pimeloyl-ACP methyl ester carboxylesterase